MIKKIFLLYILLLIFSNIKAQSICLCDSVLTDFFSQIDKYKHKKTYILRDTIVFKYDSCEKSNNKRVKKISQIDDVSSFSKLFFKPYFIKLTDYKEEVMDSIKVYSINYNVQKYGNTILWIEEGLYSFNIYSNISNNSIIKIELYGGINPNVIYKKE